MKITKKFKGMLSLALTAMLTVGSITANATENKGVPQIDTERQGSIIIHKYGVNQMPNEENSTPATGLPLTDEAAAALGKPLENVEFKIYKVDNDTTNVDQVPNKNKTLVDTITTNKDGYAASKKLDLGVYYVEESENAAITTSVDPFLVSIPMAHPTNNEWIYDVHVYPKNVVDDGVPKIDKSVDTSGDKHHTANINQEIKWIIEPQIPKDIATAKTYKIADVLDEKLSYRGYLEISFTNASGELVKLEHNKHYDTPQVPTQNGGGTLEIVFNDAGKQLLATALGEGDELPKVQIQFKTVINSKANPGEPIYNNAVLDYTNTLNQEFESIDVPGSGNKKPEVHTGGVKLEKVDAADSTITLPGAKFKIYESEQDAINGTNAVKDPDNNNIDWEVTSNAQGIVEFKGLSFGEDDIENFNGSKTYWIVETVAPKYDSDGDGEITDADKSYNILKKPFAVTVNATSHQDDNKIVVANSKFNLPVTGGIGTVIFTLGGLAIMGAAAFLYMRTTRRA